MNSNKQAAKGFKTFLLTLVISLAVFSAIYFIINTEQEEETSLVDRRSETTLDTPYTKRGSVETKTLGEGDVREEPAVEEQASVFEQLANQKMDDVAQRQVLAESDTTDTTAMVAMENTDDTTEVAQSTVPDTGVSRPTIGVVLTLVILGFAAYIMFIGPRNIALYNFEKDVMDDLE